MAFDDASAWGRCTIVELKGLICLALGMLEEAKTSIEVFVRYNDNVPSRRRFYQALNTVLDIAIRPDLELENFLPSLTRMYGDALVADVVASASGDVRFFGLTPTNMKLDGIDKHVRLVESYEKLQAARRRHHAATAA